MAQSKNTTNFEGLLFQFMDSPDPMLSMLEWLCSRMMEAEVSSKIGARKEPVIAVVFVRGAWIPVLGRCISWCPR